MGRLLAELSAGLGLQALTTLTAATTSFSFTFKALQMAL